MLSTTTLPIAPQMHFSGSANSPVEFALSLDPDNKHAVFIALLREAIELNGENGLLPIDDESGQPFGYYVPPKAAAEQVLRSVPAQSEADLERTRRSLANLEDTFEIETFLNGTEQVAAKRD